MAILASGVVVMGILAALAGRADSEAPQASPWLTTMDVAIGFAFVAAGAVAGGPLPERVLVAAAGPAWLAGSFLLSARSLHVLVLAVALVLFPSGRVRGLASWLLVGLAGLAGLQLLPQLGVAALFAAVAAVALVRFRRDLVAAWYPAAAAAAVAAVLAASWAATHLPNGTFDPTLALLGYELVLLLVAVAFPLAVRAVMRARARLADRLLSTSGSPAWMGSPWCWVTRWVTGTCGSTGGTRGTAPTWTHAASGWYPAGTGNGSPSAIWVGRSPP